MIEMFKAAVERGASDIHIKSGDVVRARLHGKLIPVTQQRLSHEQVEGLVSKLITREKDKKDLSNLLDYDCSWGLPGLGRFRVNVLRQRG
ncbi:MAG: type IV pili twitching motility protein PilT, partial [Gemmatimonadetes bacterium]|nr:type IV pili twitching motility protein PilT [Gemmatimonadota bacterium]